MQEAMDRVSQAYGNFDIQNSTSTKRAEVLYQPAFGKSYNEAAITVK